jgi:N-methylhydantoinase A/oxoprolinase/acetone carboxylase beta subunit
LLKAGNAAGQEGLMADHIVLGIDTGGTYTDAVLVDRGSGEVLAGNKAFTTYYDLSMGIREAVAKLPAGALESVEMVGLSTTLATNAIVEGKGRRTCLILIGYDRELIEGYSLWGRLAAEDVVFIRGGHDIDGREQAPLDAESVRAEVLARAGKVDAFAVSGYYSVRNPKHELQVRDLIRDLTGKPVSCGHELSAQFDSIKRATTVALNAQLIPLICELIASTRSALHSLGVRAPLMVVRADGSLMRSEMAMERPVETILSGPAASAVGAAYLTQLDQAWAVDVGGTTSDIVVLEEGRPRLNMEGAEVGNWRTMVRAVDVRTFGLGGDSRVQVDHDRRVLIGPRRSVPLCLLAETDEGVVPELQRQEGREYLDHIGEFVMRARRDGGYSGDDEIERDLLAAVRSGARSWVWLQHAVASSYLLERAVEHLERLGLVVRAGFTPTDALHMMGEYCPWCVDASRLGAGLLSQRIGLDPDAFCRLVVERVGDKITREILAKLLQDEEGVRNWPDSLGAEALLKRAINSADGSDLECSVRLKMPLVAIGAPVRAYTPRTAQELHTRLVIPEHADVANAIGAVVGSVVQVVEGTISPVEGGGAFRLHMAGDIQVFDDLERAVAYAEERGKELARARAVAAGAAEIAVEMRRDDRQAAIAAGWGNKLYLGTDLRFTAVGRPAPEGNACQYRSPARGQAYKPAVG